MAEAAIEAWHLPDAPEVGPRAWHEAETPAGGRLRAPRLDRGLADRIAREVRESALAARSGRGLAEVIGAVSRVATRIGDGDDALGARAAELLRRELAWPEELARETLAGMAAIWTESALWACVRRDLPDPAVLDGFRSEDSSFRRRRAAGPPLVLTVHAGNVPGVAVTAAIRALLVRSGSLNRVSRDEPGLLPLFASALAREDPVLGRSIAVTWWPPNEPDPVAESWVKRSGKVVVYGGAEAISSLASTVPPGVELLPYGPKLGLAVVLPDAAGDPAERAGVAQALARDALAYEGRGCVTPRAVFVCGHEGGDLALAPALADALAAETRRLPRPPLSASEASAIRAARAEAELAGVWVGGGTPGTGDEPASGGWWASDADLSWTVLPAGAGALAGDPLPGLVHVSGVRDLEELERRLSPMEGYVQAIGYGGAEGLARLADMASKLGVSRLAPLGTVAWPPADWHHDGRGGLLPLLRWTDWESPDPAA